MAASATPSSTTFEVFKDVESIRLSDNKSSKSICSQLRAYKENKCSEVIMESQFPSSVQACDHNGFIEAVVKSYCYHYNLVIRPDDVWTAILTQFSFYINKNAEEFRNQFVNFEGKQKLEVEISGTLRTVPYDVFVTKMTEKIDENLVDQTVKDWILPNFTTTTTNDMMACGIAFMATTKKYYIYEGTMFCCGIPSVTLEGTVGDWENILNRLEKLKDYKGLDKWYDMLKPILEEFVAAKNNSPNIDFWTRICDVHMGSDTPDISGWIIAFAIFDEEGNWKGEVINLDDVPSGVVTVDVTMIQHETNKKHDCIFFAGHVGYEITQDSVTIKPRTGCGIALK